MMQKEARTITTLSKEACREHSLSGSSSFIKGQLTVQVDSLTGPRGIFEFELLFSLNFVIQQHLEE